MGDLIFIGSLFCSLISAYILLVKRKGYNSYSDKLLAVLFISYAYCTSGYLLIKSEWILYVPHLYKTAQPVNFIIPPLAYLYVRSIIYNEKRFKKTDFLHFIPFLFIAINYLPLYCSSKEDKLTLLHLVVSKIEYNYNIQDGFFPESIQFTRPIQTVIYIVLQWSLLITFHNNASTVAFKEHTKVILSWLKKFTLFISLTVLSFMVFVVFVTYGLTTGHELKNLVFYSSIPTAISLFYLSIYLILNPNVLLGLPFINSQKSADKVDVDIRSYEQTAKNITSYFEKEQPFLRQNLTINEVSLYLQIPMKLLSFIINQYFKQNFNDYVNGYRVANFVERVKAGDLEKFTLYALSDKSGFSNKTTFLTAFKKVHHCTPSQFIQEASLHNK